VIAEVEGESSGQPKQKPYKAVGQMVRTAGRLPPGVHHKPISEPLLTRRSSISTENDEQSLMLHQSNLDRDWGPVLSAAYLIGGRSEGYGLIGSAEAVFALVCSSAPSGNVSTQSSVEARPLAVRAPRTDAKAHAAGGAEELAVNAPGSVPETAAVWT
jgi:hypothetical protein